MSFAVHCDERYRYL